MALLLLRTYSRMSHKESTFYRDIFTYMYVIEILPLSFWHSWLVVRKSVQPVKYWVMRCWRSYLSGARCKWFAYGAQEWFNLSGAGLPRLSVCLYIIETNKLLLWPPCVADADIIFLSCANLECRSETYCTWLAVNTRRKKSPKIRHVGTIAQLCWAISSQVRHVSTIGKKTC